MFIVFAREAIALVKFPVCIECNNNCASCVIDRALPELKAKLEPWQLCEFLDSIPGGTSKIFFTGGEPTMNPGLFELLERARARFPEAFLFLCSNARRFSYRPYAEQLAKTRLKRQSGGEGFRVVTALYSPSAQEHDAITRVQGSFAQSVAGIKNLCKLGVEVELRNLITKQSFKQAEKFAEFVAQELPNIEQVTFVNSRYTGNALKNREAFAVRLSEVFPNLSKALPILCGAKIPYRIYPFPLCLIPRGQWPFAESKSIESAYQLDESDQDYRTHAPQCKQCGKREDCMGVWKSYGKLFGFEELAPIRLDY